jgi:cell division septation protein DedD
MVTSPGELQPMITAQPTGPDSNEKKPIPMVSIPAIISIGLVIAAAYLVTRIVTAHRPAPAPRPSASAMVKPPSAPAPVPSAKVPADIPVAKATAVIKTEAKPAEQLKDVSKAVAAEDAIPMITPKTGERYIQIAALDDEATRRFVRKLRNEKIEPHVAPASKPELLRILIGPFENRDALNAEKAQLEHEGMQTFVRQY